MKKIFFVSFLLIITILSSLLNAQTYSGNGMYVPPYNYDAGMEELSKHTDFFSSFGNFGGVSTKAVVTSTCAYDKQMTPIVTTASASMARLTEHTSSSMVGTALSSVIGSSYSFTDGLYPRLNGMPSQLPGYVGAAPVFLRVMDASNYDTYNNVRHCFYVSNKNGVKWRSKMGMVQINNSTNNTTGSVRLLKTGWDTLIAYYTVTGADTLKFPSKEITKTVPIQVTAINNYCFAEEYTLTLVVQPTNTGYVTGGGKYLEGTKIPISATPEHCYRFVHWKNSKGVVVSTKQTDTIQLVSDSTLIAVFEKMTYNLSAYSDPVTAGKITGIGIYACDTTVKLTAAPADTCYKFLYWQNTATGDVLYDATMDVKMDRHKEFVAYFGLVDTFKLELKSDPKSANVTLTGAGEFFKCAANTQIKAQINDKCTIFKYWTNQKGDIISTQNPYDVHLISDSVLIANFNTTGFNVKLNPSPANGGKVNGKTSVDTMVCDNKMVIEATENDGFWFYRWVDAVTGSIVSLFNKDTIEVKSNVNLIAEFLKEPVVKVILAQKPLGAGILTGAGSYTKGSKVPITAAPISDCSAFKHWEDASGKVISTQANYTVTADTDTILIAIFEVKEFAVTIYATQSFMGNITGGTTGLYNCGTVLNLKAESADDELYGFIRWAADSSTGPLLSINPEISVTIVSDTTIVAVFGLGVLEDDIYDISIVPNPTDNDFNIIFDNIDEQFVSISLIDLTGANIFGIYEGMAPVGKQIYTVDKKLKLASGEYFVKFVINGKIVVRKVIVR